MNQASLLAMLTALSGSVGGSGVSTHTIKWEPN